MREAVRQWLEFESLDDVKREEYIMQKGTPEQPGPLRELRMLRRFQFTQLKYPGAMVNQPHIWVMELHAAIDAEDEWKMVQVANAKLKALANQ